MAVLRIAEGRVWHSSASFLGYVAEQFDNSGRFPRYREQFAAIAAGWQALDVSDMTAFECQGMSSVISEMIDAAISHKDSLGLEASSDGVLAHRLKDLLDLTSK